MCVVDRAQLHFETQNFIAVQPNSVLALKGTHAA